MDNPFTFYTLEEQLNYARRVFITAKSKSSFYRDKLKGVGKIDTYEDWLKVPFLTRDEVYNNSYPESTDMLTCKAEGIIVVSTGGSSGISRYSVFTHEEWDTFAEVQAKSMKLLGVTPKDVVANMFVAGNLWPSFLGAHEVIKRVGAVHLPIGIIPKPELKKALRYFETFKPTVLITLPTMIIALTETFRSMGVTIESVQTIQFTSEPMPQNTTDYIKSVFVNAQIKSASYTSADCGMIGYQCDVCRSNEYHVPTDFQFVEIHNFEEDRPCRQGEEGELVITNLRRFSMPIIRYRVGDIGYYKSEACACGDKNPLLVLKGRAGEDFKLGGAYVGMGEIEKAIAPFFAKKGISPNYQLKLSVTDDGRMNFILKIESSSPLESKALEEAIKESLRKEIPYIDTACVMNYFNTFEIEFEAIGNLERSPVTGKVKRLVDKRVQ